MYNEIEDILSGKVTSKWSQEEIKEVWYLIYRGYKLFNKREVKRLCERIKNNADLLRYPDPIDKNPHLWVSVLLFTPYKKLPLYINHPDKDVTNTVIWRLAKGK